MQDWLLSGGVFQSMRSGGRVVEGARLESEYTAKPYRGFESLPLRHYTAENCEILYTEDKIPINAPQYAARLDRVRVRVFLDGHA